MPIDLSVIAPRGSSGQRPQPNAQPNVQPNAQPAPTAGMTQPGQIEAFKAAIKALQRQGLSNEEILDMLLKIAEKMGLNVPEDQLRSLVESVQTEGAAPTGIQPPQIQPTGVQPGGGMPSTT